MGKQTPKADTTAAPKTVARQDLIPYRSGIAPVKPHEGAVVIGIGQKVKYFSKKENKEKERTANFAEIKVPSKKDLTTGPNAITNEAAEAKIAEIGKAIRPAIAGRVASKLASEAYMVRSYRENEQGAFTLAAKPVNVDTKIAQVAAQFGVSIEAVTEALKVAAAKQIGNK